MEEPTSKKSAQAVKHLLEPTVSQVVDAPTTSVCAEMKPVNETMVPMTYPCRMGYLPPEFVRKAERELFETPDGIKAHVQEIRNLLRKEESIEDEWFSDKVILMFLRNKKYRIQDALSSIKRTVAIIKKHAHLFQHIDPEIAERNINEDTMKFLPRRDKDGCIIAIIRLGRWNASKNRLEDVLKYCFINLLEQLCDPMTQVNGIILIYDMQHQFLRYLKYFTPFNIFFLYELFVESLAVRVKAIHLVNQSITSKVTISFILQMCSEKIRKRIMVHNKPDEVSAHVQKNVIPIEYGGELKHEEENIDVCAKTLSMPDYVVSILASLKS